MDVQTRSDRLDGVVAALAHQQYGVVARRQLVEIGVGRGAIQRALERRLLLPLHRGVYAVGHRRLTRDGFWRAGTLAVSTSFLSHRDAATLHEIGHWTYGRVTITTPADAKTTPDLRVHARRALHPDDVTVVAGIPVTSVARTILDLGDVLSPYQLANVLHEAEFRNRFPQR